MDQRQLRLMLDGRLTRRATLRGASALGASAALLSQVPRGAFAQGATPAAAAYPEVVITATDHEFDVPATIDGGWTLITLDNQGEEDHHAFFLQPTGEATVEDIQAALESPEIGPIFEVSTAIGGAPGVGPGERVSVAMNLAPGEYVLVCAIPDENGVPHYMMGMQSPIEVTARAGNALPAFADTKITMVDHQFDGLPAEVPAGMTTWEVFNDGEQLHEMGVYRLQPGVTFETILAIFGGPPEASASPSPVGEERPIQVASPEASPSAEGPPFTTAGGAGPMSSGFTVWSVFDFEPGDYFAICFVPDTETGAPHFVLGMIAPFTVS